MSRSDVLFIHPARIAANDFGADVVDDFPRARDYLERHSPAVLVFDGDAEGSESFCAFAMESAPEARWIIVGDGLSAVQIMGLKNFGRLHALVDEFTAPELETRVREALDLNGEDEQRQKLVELFRDQSATLTRLSTDLERRACRKPKPARKPSRHQEETKTRMQAYHAALLSIHRAVTVNEMERGLVDAFSVALGLTQVRVRMSAQSAPIGERPSAPGAAATNILVIELPNHYGHARGEVQYIKAEGEAFSAVESDFLSEISEALGLALARLSKLEQAETLKAQWQATFDSIPHPLCLVGRDREILKLNRAYAEHLATDFRQLLGKPWFQVFFREEFRPPVPLEAPFTFRHARIGRGETEHFEVTGQKLGLSREQLQVNLILLRSITAEVRFERRILEAAKLAELGTIGSSIAHELNNPLGGMLSFLQLILMDLPTDHELIEDIRAMEQAVYRCRDIVLNLLSFSRKQDLGDFTRVDLRDVIRKSVKLIELQTKSMGIAIKKAPFPAAELNASRNALVQAVCNILQNSIDAIAERLRADPKFNGEIELALDTFEDRYVLKIHDNGGGIHPEIEHQIFNPLFTTRSPAEFGGMGLTTALTILQEHHGHIEVLSAIGTGTTTLITLPR